jgi:UDP-N-acetylglucosamine/UDP-N-acetylgalactosamine 4-epimerase
VTATFREILDELRVEPRTWLVTGAAGFIGSNLVTFLLQHQQRVIGLDNFATGNRGNLADVQRSVRPEEWRRFAFREGDIRDLERCREACEGVEFVLHQAALGSVPRSIADPIATNANNVDGFLNMLVAARDAGVHRFVYAASSSTYGDHPELPKVEDRIGKPLSPYAVSKYVNELYAGVFQRTYGLQTVGLRYFNVFGPRQDPDGAYAAVIPRWIGNLLAGRPCVIFGDGETSRDFCYVENVLQANILAACQSGEGVTGEVYNIAIGEQTTLAELFHLIRDGLAMARPELREAAPVFEQFRKADIRHSRANISKARERLGYAPDHTIKRGLPATLAWFLVHGERSGVNGS